MQIRATCNKKFSGIVLQECPKLNTNQFIILNALFGFLIIPKSKKMAFFPK